MGLLVKEAHSGKLVDEWNKALSAAERKPEVLDMAAALSSFMAVKDEDELVSLSRTLSFLMADDASLFRKRHAQQLT